MKSFVTKAENRKNPESYINKQYREQKQKLMEQKEEALRRITSLERFTAEEIDEELNRAHTAKNVEKQKRKSKIEAIKQ